MPTINQLNAIDTITDGDLLPVYSQSNGDARKASASVVADFIAQSVTLPDDKQTQYYAPSATAFSVTVSATTGGTWLILTPTGTLAAGTIVLPVTTTDKIEVLVSSSNEVTALTIDGNGASLVGEPTEILAGGTFTMRYDAVMSTWYRTN